MDTKVLPNHTPILAGLEHPSLPGETIPAVLTNQPAQRDICPHCVWLARMIRRGYALGDEAWVLDYGWCSAISTFRRSIRSVRRERVAAGPGHLGPA